MAARVGDAHPPAVAFYGTGDDGGVIKVWVATIWRHSSAVFFNQEAALIRRDEFVSNQHVVGSPSVRSICLSSHDGWGEGCKNWESSGDVHCDL